MRLLRRAVICCLAGVAITMLIAIAASLTVKPRGTTATYIIPGKPDWTVKGTVIVKVAPGPLRTDLWLDPGPYTARQRGAVYQNEMQGEPPWIRDIALTHAGPRFSGWMARAAAYGWPRPVLYWLWDWRDEAVEGGLDMTKKVLTTGPPLRPAEPEAAVPWRILWSGLAMNSAIFAAALWLPLSAFLAWRTLQRDARARCRACAYDLRGLTVGGACPECGTPLRDRTWGARAYRWINRGLICLALALVSTLLVAWLGPWAMNRWRPPIASEAWRENPQLGGYGGRYRYSRNALADSVALEFMNRPWNEPAINQRRPPPAWALALAERGLRDDSTSGSWSQVTTVSTGWPFRSFAGSHCEPRFRVTVPVRTAAGRTVVPLAPATPPTPPSGKRVGLLQFQALSIPWHPLPAGLALNLLVHAAAWALAWLVLAFARKRMTARRAPVVEPPPAST